MPFFDPARPAYRANPYPFVARLREEAPVHWSAELQAWVLTRYADCAEVLRDSQRFTMDPTRTSGPRADAILAHRQRATLGMAPTLGTTSGPEHRALRQIVNPLFAPAAVQERRDLVVELAGRLVEDLASGAPVEFMATVANPLPKQVMVAVMGFRADDAERLQRLLATIQVARSNPVAGAALASAAENALATLSDYFRAATSTDFAADSVLGALIRSGLPVTDAVSVAAHIATVGSDPTSGAIANAVAALANHPEAWRLLREDPGRLPRAVHELLRYDSPTHIAPRFAAEDAELCGRRIRSGDSLLAVVGAANRDPEAFELPDELDVERDARRQLGFGQGEHICLGAPLALVILESVLGALLAKFPQCTLVAAPEFGRSVELRIPDRMMVRFG